jgi:choline dehydrogenase-like flavoprotein
MLGFAWDRYAPGDLAGDALRDRQWDAVIVGAGMGGGFAGLRLAQAGKSVLFLERGDAPFGAPGVRIGRLQRLLSDQHRVDTLRRRGRWDKRVRFRIDGRDWIQQVPVGNGPGGSSAIYSAAVERYMRLDFTGEHGAGGRLGELANTWPIDYDDFLPYYRAVEAMLGPCGTPDPCDPDDDCVLAPPPPLAARDAWLADRFADAGLTPYRVHVAVENRAGCTQCLGVLCARLCKSDGASRGVIPALVNHGAKIALRCEVDRLELDGDRVVGVRARHDGRDVLVRAGTVILAAGAYVTPQVLLRSTSAEHPRGAGNDRDLVGRGLMFHADQIFAVWAPRKQSTNGPVKTFASKQLYVDNGQRLGSVQALSGQVEVMHIQEYIRNMLPVMSVPVLDLAVRVVCRLVALVAAQIFAGAVLFTTKTEDYAFAENRMVPDPQSPAGVAVHYTFTEELAVRARAIRMTVRQRLRAAGVRVLFLSRLRTVNFGHAAGTCRMGATPDQGVVDPAGRVWSVANLYIADASVLPTSSGMNPSLTVAACALHTADAILATQGRAQVDQALGRGPTADRVIMTDSARAR